MRTLVLSLLLALGAALFMQMGTVTAQRYASNCCCNSTHNFFYGRRLPYDRLMYSNHTVQYARPYGYSTVDLVFPPKGYPARGTIRYIEVLDGYRDGLGACATLRSGGIGWRNVTVTLTSSRNHGINSIVNVYGHN